MAPSAIPPTEGNLTTAALSKSLSKTTNSTHESPLDSSLLLTTSVTTYRPVPLPDDPSRISTEICTDHMIQARWHVSTGWAPPTLVPYGPLSIMPTASVLHYATECFEGMKLYRGHDGRLRLFRPDRNVRRMLVSAARIALPSFDPEELLKLVVALCAKDGPRWLPRSRPGEFLYIRPTLIADDPALGVQRPKQALMYVILTCFPNMSSTLGGMRLLASAEDTVRAWPGGFGYAKVGANYGPTLAAQGEARKRGFGQVLWLLGSREENERGEYEVTEAGASNFFVVMKTKEGDIEMVTAPLGQRVILDGVTRRSVLDLASARLTSGASGSDYRPKGVAPLVVRERKILMSEIETAVAEGRLIEAFACGTAFFVSPVSCIHFRGNDLAVPMANGEIGTYAGLLKSWIGGIMFGTEAHEWGVVVEEEEGEGQN